jgi:heme-degrading monooxygenase HmoA
MNFERFPGVKYANIFSYWQSMEAVNEWRANARHTVAKSSGRQWYSFYHSMLVKIEYSTEYNTQIL